MPDDEWVNPIPALPLLDEHQARSAVWFVRAGLSPPGSFAHTIASALADLGWEPEDRPPTEICSMCRLGSHVYCSGRCDCRHVPAAPAAEGVDEDDRPSSWSDPTSSPITDILAAARKMEETAAPRMQCQVCWSTSPSIRHRIPDPIFPGKWIDCPGPFHLLAGDLTT